MTMSLSSSTGAPRSPMILSPMGPAFGDTHVQRNRGDTRFLQRDSSSGGGSGGGGRAGMTSPVRPVPNETVREGPARAHSSSPPARCRNPEWHGPPQPPPHSLLHQQLQEHRRVLAQEAPDDEPESPQMDLKEQRAWDLARAAGVIDRGCRLVWVTATSRMAGGCRQDDGDGSGGGWSSRRGEFVSWECLQESLMEHLREGTKTTRNWDDPIISPHGRVVDTPQLEFIRGTLRRGQEAVTKARWGATGDDCTEVDGDGRCDFISVEAFAKFSQWWAPLMATLGIIRNDWARTRPVRVHGFMSRVAAKRLLMQRECGTFLLRFSESKMGALVISFTQPLVSVSRLARVPRCLVPLFSCAGRLACCLQGRCVLVTSISLSRPTRGFFCQAPRFFDVAPTQLALTQSDQSAHRATPIPGEFGPALPQRQTLPRGGQMGRSLLYRGGEGGNALLRVVARFRETDP